MLRTDVVSALAAARSFLLESQEEDGLWRDYDLEPGSSEAWTTACVGCALLPGRGPSIAEPALRRAAETLHELRRPAGWGYNRRTAADADSTAWTLRLLAALGDLRDVPALSLLESFLGPGGAARTFRDPERFGTWSGEHPDVTPLVGLALIAAGAPREVVRRVRSATLAARSPGAGWTAFWWACDAYATARSLELLAASGGVPAAVRREVAAGLALLPEPGSPFETAQLLAIAVRLGAETRATAHRFTRCLLAQRSGDGGWPASPVLLVPDQRDASRASIHADGRRLLSTAIAVSALKSWLKRSAGEASLHRSPEASIVAR
ncbi:MAG TPA: prenyltransferase/squalene oxidase repeat-containing protein [Thermoanaerobaculia bacterium]